MAQPSTDRWALIRRVWSACKPDARDALAFSGIGLLALGAGMIYTPAAPIVVGLLFLLLARPWAS